MSYGTIRDIDVMCMLDEDTAYEMGAERAANRDARPVLHDEHPLRLDEAYGFLDASDFIDNISDFRYE